MHPLTFCFQVRYSVRTGREAQRHAGEELQEVHAVPWGQRAPAVDTREGERPYQWGGRLGLGASGGPPKEVWRLPKGIVCWLQDHFSHLSLWSWGSEPQQVVLVGEYVAFVCLFLGPESKWVSPAGHQQGGVGAGVWRPDGGGGSYGPGTGELEKGQTSTDALFDAGFTSISVFVATRAAGLCSWKGRNRLFYCLIICMNVTSQILTSMFYLLDRMNLILRLLLHGR